MNIKGITVLAIGLFIAPIYLLQAQSWQDHYNKGRTAIENGSYKDAVPVLLKARIIVSEQMDNKNETYRTIVNKLAEAYFKGGDFGNATVNYRDLERAFKEDKATNTKEYADMLEALAKSYEADKKVPKAASYYQQALTAREKIQGAGHKDYYQTMIGFAALCMKVKKYDLAGNFYGKLYEFGKNGYKSEPKKYAQIVKDYADLHFYTRKYEKAIALYKEHINKAKAAKTEKKVYLFSIKSTAQSYEKLGKKEEMIIQYKNFLKLYKELSKENGKDYVEELDGVINLFKEEGAYLAAIELLNSKVANIETNSIEKAKLFNEIGRNYVSAKKFTEAETNFNKSIEMLKALNKVKGADYPASLDELGRLKLALNKTDEAEKIFKDAQTLRKENLGEKHPDYATGLDSLASFYISEENYSEADTLLTKAISLKKEHLGKEHASYGNSLAMLAQLKAKLEAYEEAEKLIQASSVVISKYYGSRSFEYANSVKHIADLYKIQEKYTDAIKYYRQSLSIFEGIGKGKSSYTTAIHNSIKEVNEAQE